MHYHYFTLEQRDALSREIQGLPWKDGGGAALDFLRSPEYGICESCGSDIPFARLLQNPLLRRCAHCAD